MLYVLSKNVNIDEYNIIRSVRIISKTRNWYLYLWHRSFNYFVIVYSICCIN